MSTRSVKILAIAVVVLFGILITLNTGDRDSSAPGAGLLFPELKNRLNDVNAVTITDTNGVTTVRREEATGRWVVAEKGGYPADTATLRQLLLALADAQKLEQKTSNPQLYDRLGLVDPRDANADEEGSGSLVTARGNDAAVSLIIGDVAQREFRYVRIPEQPESWLIDQNPNVPQDVGEWLLAEIVDIESPRIRSVTIRHNDGEVLDIQRESADQTGFEVQIIPEGRELSYPTVANSIAGALANLNLEDVRSRAGDEDEADVTADFNTFEGLQVRINLFTTGDDADDDGSDSVREHWITLHASASEAEPAPAGGTEAPEAGGAAATGQQTAAEEADAMNERVSGWAYRIPEHKVTQLTRRWDDILADEQE